MPTLGDLLGAAKRSASGFQAWIEAVDPSLAAEAKLAAERSDISPAGFARVCVADFSRFADEHAWTQLMSRASNSDDPGAVCLAIMVRWQLANARQRAHPSLAYEIKGTQ